MYSNHILYTFFLIDTGSPVTYTNWATGEPTGQQYDCAIMNLQQGGLWYDYRCTDTIPGIRPDAHHYFVCEYREFLINHLINQSINQSVSQLPLNCHSIDSSNQSINLSIVCLINMSTHKYINKNLILVFKVNIFFQLHQN